MTRHKYAEFFEALANNEGDQWAIKMKDGDLMDFSVGMVGEIYCYPDWHEIVRKPKTSRKRFEEWFVSASEGDVLLCNAMVANKAWAAWQEAERQALEAKNGI